MPLKMMHIAELDGRRGWNCMIDEGKTGGNKNSGGCIRESNVFAQLVCAVHFFNTSRATTPARFRAYSAASN